jgi:hypothetical protein
VLQWELKDDDDDDEYISVMREIGISVLTWN